MREHETTKSTVDGSIFTIYMYLFINIIIFAFAFPFRFAFTFAFVFVIPPTEIETSVLLVEPTELLATHL